LDCGDKGEAVSPLFFFVAVALWATTFATGERLQGFPLRQKSGAYEPPHSKIPMFGTFPGIFSKVERALRARFACPP
jgi:hypothetical protein